MGNIYRVVIRGTQEGRTDDEVIGSLARMLKMAVEQVGPRFKTRNFVVKKSVDLSTAEKYRTFLQQHGCVCAIEPEPEPTPGPVSAVAPPTTPARAEERTLKPQTSVTPASAIPPAFATSSDSQPQPVAAMEAKPAFSNAFQAPKESRTFNGRFDMRQPLNKGAMKRYALHGKGAITFSNQGLRIVGKRQRPLWFGAPTDVVIDYADILDANVDGKRLRFNVDGLGKERRDTCYVANRPDEAAEMLGLLPTRQSDGAKAGGWLSKIESRGASPASSAPGRKGGAVTLALLIIGALALSVIDAFLMLGMVTHLPDGSRLALFAGKLAAVFAVAGVLASLYLIPKANRNIHSYLKAYVLLAFLFALGQYSDWTDKFNGPNKTVLSASNSLAVEVPSDWAITTMNKDKVDLMVMDWAGTAFVSVTAGESLDRPAEQAEVAAYQSRMDERLSAALGNKVGQFNCGALCTGSVYATTSRGKPMRILSATKYSEGRWLVIQGGHMASTTEANAAKVEAAVASARVNALR